MKAYKSHWTEEQVARLTLLWSTDIAAAVIGAEFGVSARAVCHQASVRGLKRRPFGGPKRAPVAKPKPVIAPKPRPTPIMMLAFVAPEPAPISPLRTRILAQLAKGPSDTLNLSSACGAKEMTVTQALAALESDGAVVWTPATGPRARVWRLAERIAA